jgi:alkylation response protein AidB-like acyl-CoA dehydrogenase
MKIEHPSVHLQADWVKIIRDTSAEAEKSGKIHPDQLAVIYEQQWFKLLVPAVYSGLEKSIPELVRLEESISWANGSVGWVVTLCSGAGWFGGFIEPQMATRIFNTPNVCLAGSGAATGEAIITPVGYKINGTWKYASGAHLATHFTANCIIKNGTEIVLNEDGSPLVLPFLFDSKNVKILPSWKYTGMVATGSDAFEVNELEVTDEHCFKIDAEAAVIKIPLYQYPFLQLAEATLAVNISGMAIHFLDLCAEIFKEKQQGSRLITEQKKFLKQVLTKQERKLNKARQLFYQAIDISWYNLESGIIDNNVMEKVSLYSRSLAKISRECVDHLYPYCGLTAANTETEINQIWRDLHTASQHALLTFI